MRLHNSYLYSYPHIPQDLVILPGYIPIVIRGDHMDVTKFASTDDPGRFLTPDFVKKLRQWIKEISRAAEQRRESTSSRPQGRIWPLKDAALNLVTVNDQATFQLQFTWEPCANVVHKNLATASSTPNPSRLHARLAHPPVCMCTQCGLLADQLAAKVSELRFSSGP